MTNEESKSKGIQSIEVGVDILKKLLKLINLSRLLKLRSYAIHPRANCIGI